jgi:uncharacterized protein
MSLETLEVMLRRQFEAADGRPLSFIFQGGEPLLAGFGFFARLVELVEELRSPSQPISLSVQTNGILIDDQWARLFADHNFLVGVSLDGSAALHNAYRVDLGGGGTHQRVLAGIQTLKTHRVAYNLLTVVQAVNVTHAAEVYRYLKDEIGATYLQFIPCVEVRDGKPIPASITPQQYTHFLEELFEQWMKEGYGKISIRLFDSITNALYNDQPGSCILEKACAKALVVEYNGDVYPCDFYVAEGELLGNFHTHTSAELMAAPVRLRLETEKGQLPEPCHTCRHQQLCYGGCPKYRHINGILGRGEVDYFCPAFLALFDRLVPIASEFVARVLWNEASPLERTLLFGLAQLGKNGASGVTLSGLRHWLSESGERNSSSETELLFRPELLFRIPSANQCQEALNALVARRVLTRSAQRFTFRNRVLPEWIERTVEEMLGNQALHT